MPTHFTVKCNLLVAQSGTTIQDVAELYHLHLHLSLKRGGSLGHHSLLHNQFPPFSPSSTALWDLANSRPVHCLVLSSHLFFSVCLVFFPFSLCLARWFWLDLMNERHVHTTSVCFSLRWSGGFYMVQLLVGSWHRLPRR